jgi:hypothetical protein
MFQQVVEYLEAKPVPPAGSMRRADEATSGMFCQLARSGKLRLMALPER